MSDEEIEEFKSEEETDAIVEYQKNNTPVKQKHSNDESGTPKKYHNTKVVATHYNELQEKGLAERSKSRIFYMRNFNNWIKSMLINEFLSKIKGTQKLGEPLRVLDMCCGKGGDLLKWDKGGITHLICTDIADVSVEQCQQRYSSMLDRTDQKFGKKFTAEFFSCDSTLVRLREKYKDPSMKLNLVSCQFAFHYCFESLTQAECMVRNAAECLLPGGYFIATIPDAYEIMKRQRETGKKSFGNDVYNIDFVCDIERPPLFGAKYKFHLEDVVDCPEFLVHFPTLVKLCRKNGLKLELKQGFADYYLKSIDKGKTLLSRMQALETYPPYRQNDLVASTDDEYLHAKNYIGTNYGRLKNIGTLSKSEWEATTLYLVCAFKKCKNTWDAEGKPLYEWD